MNIALLTLTGGGMSGGARKYHARMLSLLRAHPGVSRVDVFAPPQLAGPGEHTWPRGDEWVGYRSLRSRIAAVKPDVLFIPTARALRVGRIPVVSMIRNMEPLEVPFGGNSAPECAKNIIRAAAARWACARSHRIIAVSQHVSDFLVRRWRVPQSRLGVIYHGIDPLPNVPLEPPASVASVAGRRFVFTAGSIRPARGLEDAIVALAAAPADVHLVIGGKVDRGAERYHDAMQKLANECGVASRVVWAGQLDSAGMSWCFRNAAVFVMTSRAEACPNTVLEAMAAGALAVSTDHQPMPEFFQDAAIYYRERDGRDLGRQLVAALEGGRALQERLAARALARARQFTWEATADHTVAELRRAAGQA